MLQVEIAPGCMRLGMFVVEIMELKKIFESVYIIPNVTNVGIVRVGDSAILIDSGIDDEAGRRILRTLEKEHLQPIAIINTHFHADHCGANAYLKEKTNAQVYAPDVDAEFIQYPYLQPYSLFSGANPPNDLKNKFVMSRPSPVDHVIKEAEKSIVINEVELNVVRLGGHSPNQIGIELEGTLFCADSLFSEEVLAKHKIPFLVDVAKQKETLTFLRQSSYKRYVPSHGEPTNDVTRLVDAYLETIDGVEKYVLDIVGVGKRTDEILKALCDNYKIELKAIQQHYLLNTISMAFLSYLRNKGEIEFQFKENSLYWSKD